MNDLVQYLLILTGGLFTFAVILAFISAFRK